MTDRTFQQVQVLELKRLLESAKDDPILAPQLRERLTDLEKELEAAERESGSLLPKESVETPRAAIFLRGGGVVGSTGIRPGLAGEALIQYEKMFIEQAIHDEREAAKTAGRQRRPRGASTPGLLFTGTPRGSFGLEFVPQAAGDTALLDVHAQALGHVAEALVRVTASDADALDEAIRSIPSGVLRPLKQFMKTLADHDAELRLAFHDRGSTTLVAARIRAAAERLDKEVTEETVTITGVMRGVTLDSGNFDLKADTGELITGTVADNLTEGELQRINKLTDSLCEATILKTTVRTVAGSLTQTYVLLNAFDREAAEAARRKPFRPK